MEIHYGVHEMESKCSNAKNIVIMFAAEYYPNFKPFVGDGWIMRFLVSCIRKIQSSISLYRRLAKGGYGEEDYSPAPLDQPEQVYFAQNREQACLF